MKKIEGVRGNRERKGEKKIYGEEGVFLHMDHLRGPHAKIYYVCMRGP